MIKRQESMVPSQYTELYELIIPKDNLLRRIMDLVDFLFVFEELSLKRILKLLDAKKGQ